MITLFAHAGGLLGRADLPIPDWLFGWAAAMVLFVSFVALAVGVEALLPLSLPPDWAITKAATATTTAAASRPILWFLVIATANCCGWDYGRMQRARRYARLGSRSQRLLGSDVERPNRRRPGA